MNTDTLATELLHEIKASARRWFVAFCVMVGLEVATIVGFVWYISLPVDTATQEIEQDTEGGGNNSYIGGDNNGAATN